MKVLLILFFSVKKMDIFSSPSLRPRDRLLKIAPHIDLEPPRFIILVEEFNGRVKEFSCDLERTKDFSSFAVNCHVKLIDRGFKDVDVKIFSEFLSNFLKEGKCFLNA